MNRFNAIEGDRKKLTKRIFEGTGTNFGASPNRAQQSMNRTFDNSAKQRSSMW